MSTAAGSNLHFVWGPPGTGKTVGLAQTARMLAGLGERVLVLAHANVAVDVAMLRVADAFAGTDELQASRVLRIGDPHHADARRRTEILVETAVARQNPTLARTIGDLEERRRALAASLRMSWTTRPRSTISARSCATCARSSRGCARSIGRKRPSPSLGRRWWARRSRDLSSDDVWNWAPDAILLDEASMVSFPWVLLAATRVARRLVVFGDFRQLPPVFLARTDEARRWFGADGFEVAGVRARIDDGEDDPRVTLLDTQYRMAPSIGGMVSELAYSGRLWTDTRSGEAAARLSSGNPYPGESLVVVDPAALLPGCDVERKAGSFSRVNPLHVAIGLSLAAEADRIAVGDPVSSPGANVRRRDARPGRRRNRGDHPPVSRLGARLRPLRRGRRVAHDRCKPLDRGRGRSRASVDERRALACARQGDRARRSSRSWRIGSPPRAHFPARGAVVRREGRRGRRWRDVARWCGSVGRRVVRRGSHSGPARNRTVGGPSSTSRGKSFPMRASSPQSSVPHVFTLMECLRVVGGFSDLQNSFPARPVAHGFLSGTAGRPPCGGDRIARHACGRSHRKPRASWRPHSRRLSLAPRTGVQAERSEAGGTPPALPPRGVTPRFRNTDGTRDPRELPEPQGHLVGRRASVYGASERARRLVRRLGRAAVRPFRREA